MWETDFPAWTGAAMCPVCRISDLPMSTSLKEWIELELRHMPWLDKGMPVTRVFKSTETRALYKGD